MTSLEKTLKELEKDNCFQTFYRIESHQSNQNMHIEDNGIIHCQDSNLYTYFSMTKRHHYYFSEKKLANYLKDYAKVKANIRIDKTSFLNNESYKKIKNLVIHDGFNRDCNFSSIIIHSLPDMQNLLSENSIKMAEKYLYQERLPERSDPKTFKGGYGVCGPWLELLLQLTFLYESHLFTEKDYNKYLKIKRYLIQNGYTNTKGGKLPFLEGVGYRLRINEDIFSPYHKYCIANSLEQIRDENLLLPQSSLALNFRQETRTIISSYEETREKLLRKLDGKYKNYL